MSLCDKCKKTATMTDGRKLCTKGEHIGTINPQYNYCKDCEGLTNRDILEIKIHEMSDDEFALTIPTKMFEKLLIEKKCKVERIEIIEWLSQPYEEEKKYVVYRITNNNEKVYYVNPPYKKNVKMMVSNIIELNSKFTLQQANEKRNELNNAKPTDNWQIEEV